MAGKRKQPDKYFQKRPQYSNRGNRGTPRKPAKKAQSLNPVQKFFRFLFKSNNLRIPAIACGVLVVVCALAFTVWALTHKNAYEVYLGDTLQGTIAMSKTVTEKTIYDIAVAKLETEVGTKVKVKDEITFKPVHASKKEISVNDILIGNIYKKWDYEIEASVITVNGTPYANLATEQEANEVLNRITAQYINSNYTLISTQFDNAKIEKKFIKPSEIDKADVAFANLNVTSQSTVDYTVKQNDTLLKIALNYGVTVENILELNEGITAETKLKIDQSLKVPVENPLVNVTTVQEYTYTDVAKKETIEQENTSRPKSHKKIIQPGRDGQKEVTAQITCVNGFEVGEKEIISEKNLIDPVNEIVEVGKQS